MNINGTVVTIENNVEIQKQAGGVYQGTRLAYRDDSGALKEQNFHNNALKFNPKLKVSLSNLSTGDAFIMVKEKEGEFWQVKSITAGSSQPEIAATSTASKAFTSPKSTYETPEERAKKQVYIVRQSSISAAINFVDTKKASVADVISIAKQFEAYVFGSEPKEDNDIMSLVSDDLDIN